MQATQQSTKTLFPLASEAAADAFVLEKSLFKQYINRRVSIDTLMLESESSDSSFCDNSQQHRQQDQEKQPQAFGLFCQSFAHNFDGDFVKKFEQKEIYLFHCALGHRFMLTKKQVLAGAWCNSCTKTHTNIQRYVAQNKGLLLSPSLLKFVTVQCEKKHTWEVSYKKVTQKWCKECSRTNKKMLKEMLSQENKRVEDEKRVQQVG